ncbi:MAG: TolC family protein [Spirochaetales bacterium]|nr:TolC family protein [Spirochaetales bacterium]
MSRVTEIIILICIVFFSSVHVFAAEEPIMLELDVAIKMAIENNLQVKSAETDVNNKQRSRDSVWNEFLPSISASASLVRTNDEPVSFPGFPTSSQWSLATSVGAQLTLSMNNVHAIRKAMLDYESGLTSLVKARSLMKQMVTQQFYSLLLMQEQLKIAQFSFENAAARFRQAQIDYRNGLISEFEMLNTQVYYENSKPAVVEIENTLSSMEAMFKLTLGFELVDTIELKGSLEVEVKDYSADELVKKYLNQRFDVIETREAIALLQNSIDMTSAMFFPSVTIGFTVDPTINGPFEKDWFDGDNWSQPRGAFSISIRQLIDPLIPNSKTQLTIAKLESQKALTTEQLTYLYKSGESSIREKVKVLAKIGSGIKTKELSVRVAERAYALAREAYNAGGIDLLQLKDSEQELLRARLTLLQEKYNYLKGVLELEYELNMDFSQEGENK